MEEIWKDIDGFIGIYQISNLGRIKRVAHFSKCPNTELFLYEKINKKRLDRYGYEKINLTKCKKNKTKQVHRLVAEAFIPNPENKPQINHKNGIKIDNRVDNLEWVTLIENLRHAYDVLNVKKHYKGNEVFQFDLDGNFIKSFEILSQIKRIYGYCISSISKCCNHKQKYAYNFIWKYPNS